jgi:sensor histidine kinase YesM
MHRTNIETQFEAWFGRFALVLLVISVVVVTAQILLFVENANVVWNSERSAFILVVRPALWSSFWARLAVLLAVAVGLASVITVRMLARARAVREKRRLKREQERRENALRHDKEVMTRVAMEFQLKTLHLQINPHFLRNAITPLHTFIVRKENDRAEHYLAMYDDLMTSLIEQTRAERTSVEQEITFLKAYMELECYQSGNAFTFSVTLTTSCKEGALEIPPMLVQPHCENAIRHGIMPLKYAATPRRGHVEVRFDCTETHLVCVVKDNGVGRVSTANDHYAPAPRRAARRRRSFASDATNQRLELLRLMYDLPVEQTIEDRINETGENIGTTVCLKIPHLFRTLPELEENTEKAVV